MPAFDSLDFLNVNSLRNYPLKEGVTRRSIDGIFIIPNDLVVDFQFAGTTDVTKRFYISKLGINPTTLSIEISDNNDELAALVNIPIASHVKYNSYVLTPSSNYLGANGVIVIDSFDSIKLLPSGVFSFALAATELETRTIVTAAIGISRIIFHNANGKSYALTGDINIEARTNLKFKLGDNNRIILDAGDGLGLNEPCENELGCIKTINNIPPDIDGNFTLDFSDCATLTPIPAGTGLVLQDICCKPCVGCNDIEILTTRLITAEDTLLTLRQYYTDLKALFEDFKITTTYTCDCPPES